MEFHMYIYMTSSPFAFMISSFHQGGTTCEENPVQDTMIRYAITTPMVFSTNMGEKIPMETALILYMDIRILGHSQSSHIVGDSCAQT